jgi:succinoglycan biosynthesis transport protein ExoP
VAADRTPPDLDLPLDDAPTAGPSPLQVVARRWPLLLVGLALGAVIGVIIHIFSTPMYQSNAQVLVVKKREAMLSGNDVRTAVVEDYVATQLTLIKSEKIRRAAANELKPVRLNNPLPADDLAAAEVLKHGLAVTRDKDSTSPNQIGSGIVNLAYRTRDPQDARRILEGVIHAYQKELSNVFDAETQKRLEVIKSTIKAFQDRKQLDTEVKIAKTNELRKITTENIASIQARVTALKNRVHELDGDLIKYEDQLRLIESAGPNRKDRLAIFALLTNQNKPGGLLGLEPNGPEARLRLLEADHARLSRMLGKDHEKIQALRDEMDLLQKLIDEQNPDTSKGLFDELAVYEGHLKQLKSTAERQKKDLQARLNEDERTLEGAGQVQDEIDAAAAAIQLASREIDRLDLERTQIETTQGAGGYAAHEITPPGEGLQVAPVLLQSILLGLAIGLMLGGLGVVTAELTDKSFKSPAEIRRRLGLPVIGHIPQIRVESPTEAAAPAGLDPVLAAALRPKSAEAEAYRGLRTQLYFSTQGRGHQVIQVTSPNPGDGKSTLAANLAVSIAQSGKRAALIDCDFRKPRVHRIFDVPSGEVGLAGVIAGEAPLAAAVRPSGLPNLDLLPCGPRPANPAELLTSPQFQEVLGELRSGYDFVIVDTPPLLAVSDPAVVAPRVDGVLLVFRMTKRVRPAAERAREQLAALGANVLGVVVNGWASGGRGYSDYNYGASYGYRYADYEYADDYADDPSYHGGEAALPAKG